MVIHEIYATCAALDEGACFLFLGESGSGKTDMALRLMDVGWKLISDDRVALIAENNKLFAMPTVRSQGLIEMRGVGVYRLPEDKCLAKSKVIAAIQCEDVLPQRLQDPLEAVWCGVPVPFWRMRVKDPSSTAKLRLLAASLTEKSEVLRV